jgi:putative oxidoreductase
MEERRASGSGYDAMKQGVNRYLLFALRIILGLIFLYAGVPKILDVESFAQNVNAYKMLPYFFNYLVAATLPWVEAVSGLLLVIGYKKKAAAGIIAGMNVFFIILLTITMLRGLDIDCGCFNQGGEKVPLWLDILRDALFLGAAVILLSTRRERKFSSS